MLVPFSIEPAALGECRQADAATVAVHRRCLELLDQFGVMWVEPRDLPDGDLGRAVEALPATSRKLWKEVLVALQKRNRLTQVDGARRHSGRDVQGLPGKGEQVLCIGEDSARGLGWGPGDTARVYAGRRLELCRLACVDESQAFRDARSLATDDIVAGLPPSKVWEARFAPRIAVARHMAVIDRYCVTNFCGERPVSQSGLERLVDGVSATGRDLRLTVLSAWPKNVERAAVRGRLKQLLGKSRGPSEVRLCGQREFGELVHFRTVRIDEECLDIDTGLEVLQGVRVPRSAPFALRRLTKERRDLEWTLRQKCELVATRG